MTDLQRRIIHQQLPPGEQSRVLEVAPILCVVALLAGCATYKPAPESYRPHLERAETSTNGPIVASVAVPSQDEAEKIFGIALHKKEIQPVWVRIENRSTNPYFLMPAALDPDYYSPAEVAYMHRRLINAGRNRRVSQVMESNRMNELILPGTTNEGYIFSTYDPGAKHVRLELIGERDHRRLEFTLAIPGRRYDYQNVNFTNLYRPEEVRDYPLEKFLGVIEQLPATTTDRKGTGNGDPVNLVVVRSNEGDVATAFLRQDWDLTESLSFGNALKLVGSVLFQSRWRTSPVSSLYLFGRPQDFALQKARGTIHERNHLRLWLAPFTCEGRPVLVGQISRDIGLRFTFKAPGFFTHKIDPDTDEARDYVAQELLMAGSVSQIATVGGVGHRTLENPGRNLTGDPWFTNGRRVVLFLSADPVPPNEVHFIDWSNR